MGERWLKAQEKEVIRESANRVHWKQPKPPVSCSKGVGKIMYKTSKSS